MVKISVSILSKDDNETIAKLNNTDADYFHIDAMDGKFVDNINMSVNEINELKKIIDKNMDIHLMMEDPNIYIEQLNASKIEYITVHYEILNGDLRILKKIKNKGIKCGISVKPSTDIKDIFCLLDNIDLVLIMSVEPGYGGQEFLSSSLMRVKLLKEEIQKRNLKTIIAIDGGINKVNAKSCVEAGCDMLVPGSYIVLGNDYQALIDSLRY